MSKPKKMRTAQIILKHTTIEYWYDPDVEMPEREENHVQKKIINGFSCGTLLFFDENGKEIDGWWKIKANIACTACGNEICKLTPSG